MGKKAKKGTGNSKPKAIVITPHKIHAKIYFSGSSFIVVDLPDTFDKNSDVDITSAGKQYIAIYGALLAHIK